MFTGVRERTRKKRERLYHVTECETVSQKIDEAKIPRSSMKELETS